MGIGWFLIASMGYAQDVVAETTAVEPGELSEHYQRMTRYHERMDGSVPREAVLFIGDSITQGLCVAAVHPHGVNYGIGSDTTAGVLHRLNLYASVDRAAAVVLAIGVNDLRRRDDAAILVNIERIRDHVCARTALLVSAILPLDERNESVAPGVNKRIAALNAGIAHLCHEHVNCGFIHAGKALCDESGNLAAAHHVGDGVHPNTAGYAIWIEALKQGLEELRSNALSETKNQ